MSKCPAADRIDRELQADLVSYARAWDGVLQTLFFGRRPDPEQERMDDETYCVLHCARERREGEDCALDDGCPLEKADG